MFSLGVAAVSAPAGLSHTAGGVEGQPEAWEVRGGQGGRARGAEGAGAAALCPQHLLMSLGFVFT